MNLKSEGCDKNDLILKQNGRRIDGTWLQVLQSYTHMENKSAKPSAEIELINIYVNLQQVESRIHVGCINTIYNRYILMKRNAEYSCATCQTCIMLP